MIFMNGKNKKPLIFGTSGTGKTFSGILHSLEFEKIINSDNTIESLPLSSLGAFISDEYIKSKTSMLGCSEEFFKLFLLILNKNDLSPLGKEIFFDKDTFKIDNLKINIKIFNEEQILEEIFNDFKEDFDCIFDENMMMNSDREKSLFILNNYKDFYGEPLNKIYNYQYFIKKNKNKNLKHYIVKNGDNLLKIAKNYKTDIDTLILLNPNIKDINLIYPSQEILLPEEIPYLSKDILELDLKPFLFNLRKNSENFYNDLSECYFKGVIYHFLYNKDVKNLVDKVIDFDLFKEDNSFIKEERNYWLSSVLSVDNKIIIDQTRLDVGRNIKETIISYDSYI